MADLVTIADSILYGRYKQFRTFSGQIAQLSMEAVKHARTFMDLPESLRFHIRPLGGKYNGVYINYFDRVELDPRRKNLGVVLSTIMHELVHAEQFHTGRLKLTAGTYHWNDEAVKKLGNSYEEYKNRPWQTEAFTRQDELAKKITAMIVADKGSSSCL